MNLAGRTAIVTGGGRGIGKAITLKLAQQGANLVIAGKTPEPLHAVVKEVEALGRKAIAVPTDVSNYNDVKKMIAQAIETFGQVDILVNNAGGSARQKMSLFCDSTEETWDYVLGTNLKGVFYTCREVVGPMLARKSGVIINIASVAGMIGTAGQADYSAAKAGVIGLTMAMAKEMAASNVRINCVSPGPTVNDAVAKKPEGFALSPVTQELFKSTGFGRFGAAEDIANLVAFLASDDAAFITGQNYAVCGVMNLGITQYLGA